MNKSVVIVIPTYNARDGIIDSILNIHSDQPKATIIIVDDNSPDGTASLVQSRFGKDKKVKLIVRNGKGGRGSAVIAGLQEGLKDKEAEYFVEMDADLCHDPKYITDLVKKCQKNDVVIASKYLRGSTITGLKLKRIVISRLMNMGARLLLQVPITDYSNGFRCYNRRVVEFITKQRLRSKGFVVLSEIVYLCYQKGFTFGEIPFNFEQVSSGESNLNLKEINEATLTLLRLRFGK